MRDRLRCLIERILPWFDREAEAMKRAELRTEIRRTARARDRAEAVIRAPYLATGERTSRR